MSQGLLEREQHIAPVSQPPVARKRWRSPFIALLLIGGVFMHRGWFDSGLITANDWFPLSSSAMKAAFQWPQLWDAISGFGQTNAAIIMQPLQFAFGLASELGMSYAVAERVIVFFPFVVLPFVSSYMLARRFTTDRTLRTIAAAVYGINTYILLVGNSQMTVAMGYALAPLAVASTLDVVNRLPRSSGSIWSRVVAARSNVVSAVIAGGWLGIIGTFDSRMAFVTAIAMFALLAAGALAVRQSVVPAVSAIAILGMFVLLNAYWILPLYLHGGGEALTGLLPDSPWISWTQIPQSFGLYHPFWTGHEPAVFAAQPLWPLALVLPLFAFGGLLSRRLRADWRVVTFAVIALLGVFLVKGENPPYGGFYTWMFHHVPGMRLFRDMSKFSLLVALGYSVLVPLALQQLTKWSRLGSADTRTKRSRFVWVAMALVVVNLAWVCRPAITGELGGTLNTQEVPSDYTQLNNTLDRDADFGRVLWAPLYPRFATRSAVHPSVQPADLVTASSKGVPNAPVIADPFTDGLSALRSPTLVETARSWAIRYVAIVKGPADASDSWPGRTSADKEALIRMTLNSLNDLPGLSVVQDTRYLTVYAVDQPTSFATLQPTFAGDADTPIVIDDRATSHRSARIPGITPGQHDLLIRESFEDGWKASFTGHTASGDDVELEATTARTPEGMTMWRFRTPEGVNDVSVVFTYGPQRFADVGTIIAIISTALFVIAFFVRRRLRSRAMVDVRDRGKPVMELAL